MTKTRHSGFTLIELMIVLVIVAILAMIAYPAYQDAVRKSNRAAAESHLMDIAQRQQQYLLDNRGYAGDATCTSTGLTTLNVATPPAVSSFYTICVQAGGGPPPNFTAIATPRGSQTRDLNNQPLTIDNTGAKSPPEGW